MGAVGGRRNDLYEEARNDRDANSFCSFPRLLRPFLRMQIVGGRRRGMRSSFSEGVRGRKNKDAVDYEYTSFTISYRIDAEGNVIQLCLSSVSLFEKRAPRVDFYTT